jgi:hypothetical protein
MSWLRRLSLQTFRKPAHQRSQHRIDRVPGFLSLRQNRDPLRLTRNGVWGSNTRLRVSGMGWEPNSDIHFGTLCIL